MRVASLLVVAGCGFNPQSPALTDGGDDDGGPDIDAPDDIDAPEQCVSFSGQLDTCVQTFGAPITITTDSCWDTDMRMLFPSVDCNGPGTSLPDIVVPGLAGDIDLLIGTDVRLNGGVTLRVVGARAFGMIASNVVEVAGTIDAVGGAGARSRGACSTSAGGNASNDNGGAPGGGGGAFRAAGGKGGDGDSNGGVNNGAGGGNAGTLPAGPLGGCPGGNGGNGGGNTAGLAGIGGGAVYLTAGGQIVVSGTVNVGGVGGFGGKAVDGGGGGGGSGGMILIESPMLSVNGTLAANGGAGGGGAGGGAGGDQPGMKGGNARGDATAATGGPGGGTAGTDGADGGAGANLVGADRTGVLGGGGGGGGGGVGFVAIKVGQQQGQGTISPDATPFP